MTSHAHTTTSEKPYAHDTLPKELVTASGGRRRYFVCEQEGRRISFDVVTEARFIALTQKERPNYREVGRRAYEEFGRRHAGVTYLNNVFLSDATHTKLRAWVRQREERLRETQETPETPEAQETQETPWLYPERDALRDMAAAILASWVEEHL